MKYNNHNNNVVLEILPHNAFQTDNVDNVISYDSLVESIDYQFYAERVNLLETVAERIAQSCLDDVRAVRVFVRIEKLEKISGGLGVEIVRENIRDLSKLQKPTFSKPKIKTPLKVLHLSNSCNNQRSVSKLVNVIRNLDAKYILLPSQDPKLTKYHFENINDFYVSLLSMDQSAWMLAKHNKSLLVVDSRAELDWAIKNDRIPVWAPYNMYSKAIDLPKKYLCHSLYLGCWLADEIGAVELIEIKQNSRDNIKIEELRNFQIPILSLGYDSFICSGT